MALKTIEVSRWNVRLSVRGLLVVLGGTLMLLSTSIDYSYGNLMTYVISYLRVERPGITYADWIFFSQTKVLVGGICGPLSGLLAEKVGIKLCLIISCVIYTGGYFLTYFALELGLWPSVLTISFCHGLGYALVYPTCAASVLKWFPVSLRGFFGSFVIAGYGFGSVIWNPLETAFVNPDNVKVEEVEGEDDLYFLDDAVLNRVPKLFLVIGACFLALQVPAILLVREPTKDEALEIQGMTTASDEEIVKDYEEEYHVRPRDVIKLFDFWKLYVSFMALTMLSNVISNYQKAFGQNFIQDDAYFAIVATLQNVANGLSRIVWGFFYDRKGFQFCVFVISCISTCIAFSFANLALLEPNSIGAKIFFATYIIGLFCFLPGSFACFPVVVNEAFGHKYCSGNYGAIFTSSFFYSLILLLITQTVFDIVGYTGMFLITGLIGVLGTITSAMVLDTFITGLSVGMVAVHIFPATVTSERYRPKFEK